jgi:leucine dehydrogenase
MHIRFFDSDDFDQHEQVTFFSDPSADLRAIIGVHSTVLGPAIGGCRIMRYESDEAALHDVLRLSRGMTYKAAVANVPFGGGKMVVMVNGVGGKTPELLQAVGRAIDRMAGSYITGEDVGTTLEDMAQIAKATDNVMGCAPELGGSGDPSLSTASGVFHGMLACIEHATGRSDLRGMRVAIQGLGNVGRHLCALLSDAGAELIVADIVPERAVACASQYGARLVASEDILGSEADILAPCALGAIINEATLPQLKVRIIAGAANNQLAKAGDAEQLRRRGILYAPDYVINAGGMVQLAAERLGQDSTVVSAGVRNIAVTLRQILRQADTDGVSTLAAADRIAVERIRRGNIRRGPIKQF